MSNRPKGSFFNRNAVTIVMIPSLIGLHFMWNQMQYNRSLVTETEQIPLPIVTFAKYCWRRVQGLEAEGHAAAAAKPAVAEE